MVTSSQRLKPWDSWRARRSNSTTDAPGSQEPGLMGFLLEVSSSPEVRSTGGPDAFTCAARPKPEACPMPWGMRDVETSGISIISDGYVESLDPRLKSSACGSISVIYLGSASRKNPCFLGGR